MLSAAKAALRRSRSKSIKQISGAGEPSQSAAESVSWTRYSERWERNLTRGADSANCFRTVQVSSSKHTPTTESGSVAVKLSRGELLSASRMDIGFISDSEHSVSRAMECHCCLVPAQASSPGGFCRKPEYSKI